ncbi:MAG: NAD-dependent deacylase [Ignavibacteriales bacterium]|nr:NAD-dependent deacylase [Ignavibacteriales bacterium]
MTISEKLREVLQRADSICVLTGAGLSAESGVPTFRGDDGIWKKFKPEELASFDAFIRNPALVWEWYSYRKKVVGEVKPNAGHYALAQMQDLVADFTHVTQNVDNLHARAGCRGVLELHGNITRSLCIDCGRHAGESTQVIFTTVPKCEFCGGLLRPDVVWFGELLPAAAFEQSVEGARRCDLFLSIGTSGVVHPAASLPLIAREAGASVVEINPVYTDLSAHVHETLLGKSGDILPQLVTLMKESHHHEPT